jgi:hypothetical protein
MIAVPKKKKDPIVKKEIQCPVYHILRVPCSTGPGSFLEVTHILPFLTAASPHHPSFHVVAPSLSGYPDILRWRECGTKDFKQSIS